MKGYEVSWLFLGLNLFWLIGAAFLLSILGFRIFGKIGKTRDDSERLPLSGKRWVAAALFLAALGVFVVIVLPAPIRSEGTLSVDGRQVLGKENFFGRMDEKQENIQMSEEGLIRSQPLNFSSGSYRLTLTAYGNSVVEETARLQVYLDRKLIADYHVDTSFIPKTFSFYLPGRTTARIRICYLNDYYDPVKKLDRNVHIKEMIVEKVSSER